MTNLFFPAAMAAKSLHSWEVSSWIAPYVCTSGKVIWRKTEAYFSSQSRMTVEAQPFRDSPFKHKCMVNAYLHKMHICMDKPWMQEVSSYSWPHFFKFWKHNYLISLLGLVSFKNIKFRWNSKNLFFKLALISSSVNISAICDTTLQS